MFALKQYAETQLEENLSLSRHVLSRINIKIRWFRNDFLSTVTNYIWQKISRIEIDIVLVYSYTMNIQRLNTNPVFMTFEVMLGLLYIIYVLNE